MFLSIPVSAATADYQRCKIGESCIIGEFLYDDDYNPIATASCTLTSRDPSGAVFLNSVAMTASSDGWYSYSVTTTSQTEGLYRSQMCCTESSNYMCLDKSFYIGPGFLSTDEVKGAVWNAQTSSHTTDGSFGKNLQNPTLTSSDIWSYTSRTLSGFGSLVSDIWSYSTRSLTSFGTLVADLWKNSTRTLTSADLSNGEELATSESIERTSYSIIKDSPSAGNNKNTVDSLSFGRDAVFFEVTVTNPSSLITQKIPFIYHFPNEVKKEDIVKIDERLAKISNNKQVLGASTDDSRLFVSGEVELPPLASKVYDIKVRDVWILTKEEIESLRKQAKSLFEPLVNTSFFAQGATLKSDIDANLDRAWLVQRNPLSPQEKIENYRRALAEYNLAKTKVDSLKVLVAQAGSAKSLFGFIGGVQVASVWGMVIILVAGFIFLALFMKTLINNQAGKKTKEEKKPDVKIVHHYKTKFVAFFLMIGAGIIIGLIGGVKSFQNKESKAIKKIFVSPIPTSIVSPTISLAPTLKLEAKKYRISEDNLNIREGPGIEYKKIGVVQAKKEVFELDRQKDIKGESWINIQFDENKSGWIMAKYIEIKEANE